MVIAALAAVTLLLFVGLALDVGSVWSGRAQSQHVADAAALAAAAELVDGNGSVTVASLGDARAAADEYAGANMTIGNPQILLAPEDVTFGSWNACANPPFFDASAATEAVTAVRVDVHLDGKQGGNAAPPTFFAGLLRLGGDTFDGFEVTSTATAYLGYEGAVPASHYGLPLAVSACAVPGGCCAADFCASIASVLEPCASDPTMTCLAPELENACWTGFESALSPAELSALITSGSGNPSPIAVGDDLELLGGPLTPDPLVALQDHLDALGSGPLVVKLPVMACQAGGGNPCAAASLPVTGSICFQVEGIELGPPGQIAGHFLCSDDPLFDQYCRDSTAPPRRAGGCNYGIAADRAVLVQ